MNIEIQQQLGKDFETYMFKFYNEYKRFDIQDFSSFSSTLLNYYVNNRVIDISDKKETAYYLTTLFNKGMGNRILEEHLQLIAHTIISDYSVDFTVVQRLFG